jgi:hypothetical protein
MPAVVPRRRRWVGRGVIAGRTKRVVSVVVAAIVTPPAGFA